MTTSTGSRLSEEQKQQVRFWFHTIGCDLVACYSQIKNKFKENWSNNTFKKDIDYEALLEQGFYDDGVAIICSQLRHGRYKGKWITCLDFDSKDAFDKFCEILGTNLEKLTKWTRVEWHNSLERMHVSLISKKPFKNLAAAGIEVKANKLLAFVSPSLHKSGEAYRAFDSESIVILDVVDQLQIESIIEIFVKTRTNDERNYFDEEARNKYIEYLNAENTILRAGERHPGTIANGTSMFFKHKEEWRDLSDPQRFEKLVAWHKKHCRPSLFEERGREHEVQAIWDDICKKFTGKRQQERDAREEISNRLIKLVDSNLLPDIKRDKDHKIRIHKGILSELYRYNITSDQLPNLKALADYMGVSPAVKKNEGQMVIICTAKQLTKYFDSAKED
jgi:hypothetical protein